MNTSIDNLSIPALLRNTAGKFASQTAIVFNGKAVGFSDFDSMSDHVAAGLTARGITKGDRVGLYCINSDFFALAYFGIVKSGASVVPINLLLNPKEVAYILNDSGAKGLIYFEAFAEAVNAIRTQLDTVTFFAGIGSSILEGDITWAGLLSAEDRAPQIAFDCDNDVAVIIYTSGTTGQPKGAMLTHRNLIHNTLSAKEALRMRPGEDIFLVVLPMFHAFAATVGMLLPLLHGGTLVPLPRFEPETVANAVQNTGTTIFFAVPSMYNVLLRLPAEATEKFSSLRYCISGGAAMPLEIMEQFENRFGIKIYEGDGPTECSPVTCVNPIGGQTKPGSVGPPVPGVEMKILSDNGDELPVNSLGEICVRGANVMKGYWNRPEETKASFHGDWFRTGDLGKVDEDGYFYIVDRIKDMIIVNGMNVYPRVIEEVLYRFGPVREVAVVGEPHKLHGEIPVAFVALKEGFEISTDEVRSYCRDHLGRHEVPRKVVFMAELPKNAAGKILKRELRRSGEIERGVDLRPET